MNTTQALAAGQAVMAIVNTIALIVTVHRAKAAENLFQKMKAVAKQSLFW